MCKSAASKHVRQMVGSHANKLEVLKARTCKSEMLEILRKGNKQDQVLSVSLS